MQRRTSDAPYALGKLGVFGGQKNNNESPDECIRRELKEETSLDIKTLNITALSDFIISKGVYPEDRRFFVYESSIPKAEFAIFEGAAIEVYGIEELKGRQDLVEAVDYYLSNGFFVL